MSNESSSSSLALQRQWEMYSPPASAVICSRSTASDTSDPASTAAAPSACRKPLTVVLLGEAPGADEVLAGRPFIGASGKLLTKVLLPEAGLSAANFHILNTFLRRPPDNNLELWTGTKTDAKKEGWSHEIANESPILKQRYLRPEHRWQLAELDTRLRELAPDLIVCLGAVALWAVTGAGGIGNARGNFFRSRYGEAIATYHPAAAVLRQWSFRPLVWADLNKVRCWIDGTLPQPLKRRLWINPTFQEITNVYCLFQRNPAWVLGVDIETKPAVGQITCISFASEREGICIPIWNKDADSVEGQNYWPSVADEVRAWRWIQRFAQLSNRKVMQNGLYDAQYLLDAPIDIRVRNCYDDTAILMHALQPELPKALGTLSSLFLNEPSWKQMRTAAKDENKADD